MKKKKKKSLVHCICNFACMISLEVMWGLGSHFLKAFGVLLINPSPKSG